MIITLTKNETVGAIQQYILDEYDLEVSTVYLNVDKASGTFIDAEVVVADEAKK